MMNTNGAQFHFIVIKLNEYIWGIFKEKLRAHGANKIDILPLLFGTYMGAKDEQFRTHIQMKEDAYNDGADISQEALMELAGANYKIRLEKGVYNAPTRADEVFVAMEATISQLKEYGGKSNKDKFTMDDGVDDKAPTDQTTKERENYICSKSNKKFFGCYLRRSGANTSSKTATKASATYSPRRQKLHTFRSFRVHC
jgi:hypothetical protein